MHLVGFYYKNKPEGFNFFTLRERVFFSIVGKRSEYRH